MAGRLSHDDIVGRRSVLNHEREGPGAGTAVGGSRRHAVAGCYVRLWRDADSRPGHYRTCDCALCGASKRDSDLALRQLPRRVKTRKVTLDGREYVAFDAHDLMVRESDDRADFRPGMPY